MGSSYFKKGVDKKCSLIRGVFEYSNVILGEHDENFRCTRIVLYIIDAIKWLFILNAISKFRAVVINKRVPFYIPDQVKHRHLTWRFEKYTLTICAFI